MTTEKMFVGFSVAAGKDRFNEQIILGGPPIGIAIRMSGSLRRENRRPPRSYPDLPPSSSVEPADSLALGS
jgi:hypothetical protein